MTRVEEVTCVAAMLLLVVITASSAVPVGASVGTGQSNADGESGWNGVESSGEDDAWKVTSDVTVYRNGTARVVLTTTGSVDRLRLTKRNVNGLEILEGNDAATVERRHVSWDPSASQRLVYRVELGNARRYGSAVLENAILFRTSELLSVRDWYPDRTEPPVRRLVVHAPAGWTEAVPGEKVGPDAYELAPTTRDRTFLREMVAVGDFEVRTWSAGDDAIRYASFPGTDGPAASELEALLTASMPVLEEYTGADPEYPLLAMTVPRSIERGGVARDHSFAVSDASPTFDVDSGRSTYVHELVHTYQHNWGAEGNDWLSEGMASYYQHLVLREAGLVTPEAFRRMVRVDTTEGYDEVGDPVSSTAPAMKYKKGEAVYAALDLSVRAQTGGEKHVGDVVARFNEQTEESDNRFYVSKSEFLAAVEAVTGASHEAFYANFVESAAYPDVLLSESYSLADPPTVDPGPIARSALLERNAELRTQVDRLNETVESLRNRLDRRNGTIESLRERLRSRAGTINTLQDRLDQRNQTLESLRDRLDRRNQTVQALRDRLDQRNQTVQALRDRLDQQNGSTATTGDRATSQPRAESDSAANTETSDGSGDLGMVGLVAGLGLVFGLGVRVGRRD